LTELGISPLFQNMLSLRYVEIQSRMARSMIIPKMRSTHHDESIIEFSILPHREEERLLTSTGSDNTDGRIGSGIIIKGTFEDYTGILTGVPQRTKLGFADQETELARQHSAARKKKRRAEFMANERLIRKEEESDKLQRTIAFDKEAALQSGRVKNGNAPKGKRKLASRSRKRKSPSKNSNKRE